MSTEQTRLDPTGLDQTRPAQPPCRSLRSIPCNPHPCVHLQRASAQSGASPERLEAPRFKVRSPNQSSQSGGARHVSSRTDSQEHFTLQIFDEGERVIITSEPAKETLGCVEASGMCANVEAEVEVDPRAFIITGLTARSGQRRARRRVAVNEASRAAMNRR